MTSHRTLKEVQTLPPKAQDSLALAYHWPCHLSLCLLLTFHIPVAPLAPRTHQGPLCWRALPFYCFLSFLSSPFCPQISMPGFSSLQCQLNCHLLKKTLSSNSKYPSGSDHPILLSLYYLRWALYLLVYCCLLHLNAVLIMSRNLLSPVQGWSLSTWSTAWNTVDIQHIAIGWTDESMNKLGRQSYYSFSSCSFPYSRSGNSRNAYSHFVRSIKWDDLWTFQWDCWHLVCPQ